MALKNASVSVAAPPPRKTHVYQMLTPVAVLLWLTGAARLHKDGDGFDAVWRTWHPVTWLMLVLMTPVCAVMGEQLFRVVPLRLTPFWLQHRDQLQVVTPFTRLDALKEFVHRPLTPERRQALADAR